MLILTAKTPLRENYAKFLQSFFGQLLYVLQFPRLSSTFAENVMYAFLHFPFMDGILHSCSIYQKNTRVDDTIKHHPIERNYPGLGATVQSVGIRGPIFKIVNNIEDNCAQKHHKYCKHPCSCSHKIFFSISKLCLIQNLIYVLSFYFFNLYFCYCQIWSFIHSS